MYADPEECLSTKPFTAKLEANRSGRIVNATLLDGGSGFPKIDEQIIEILKQAEFQPIKHLCKGETMTLTLPLSFGNQDKC